MSKNQILKESNVTVMKYVNVFRRNNHTGIIVFRRINSWKQSTKKTEMTYETSVIDQFYYDLLQIFFRKDIQIYVIFIQVVPIVY